MTTCSPSTRRAFTINPLIVLLFVILVGICAYRAWMIFDRINASGATGARVSGMKFGAVGVPLVVLVIAGGLGTLVYFLARKSMMAANVAIGLVLLLAVGLFGYNTYAIAMAPPVQVAQKQPTVADQMRANSAQMKQGLDAQREALQRQSAAATEAINRHNQAAREATERTREAMMNRPAPGAASTPSTPPTPASAQPTPGTVPSPTPPRPPPANRPNRPTPAHTPSANEVAAKPILDALAAEVTTQIDDVSATLTPLLDTLGKPPRQDIREIKKRIADIAAAREPLAALSKRLRDMSTEGNDKLKAAGIDSVSAAHMYTADYKAVHRAFAADAIIRMLDDADTEATILRDGIGRWSIGKDGKIESKDFTIKSKANSARFMLNVSLERKNQLLDDLKGR